MYAVDNLSDAIDVTRDFLTPVRKGTWLRLAVIVFFVSGIGLGMPFVPTGDEVAFEDETEGFEEFEAEFGVEVTMDDLYALAIAIGVIVFALWLVFTFVRAILEFVLVESLRSGDVRVRRWGKRHFSQALSLFGFILALSIIVGAAIAAPGYFAVSGADSLDDVSVSTMAALGLLAFGGWLFYAVVLRLTTEFVVPIMIEDAVGIRAGWKRFLSSLRSHPGEYAVYVVLATIISVIASIAIGILWVLSMIVLAIPFFLLVVLAFLLGPFAIPLAVLLVLLFVVSIFLLLALYEVPVIVYVRYYALLLLGDLEESVDLIPDQRAAVRATDGWNGRDAWDDDTGGSPDDLPPGRSNEPESDSWASDDTESDDSGWGARDSDSGHGWDTDVGDDRDGDSGHGWNSDPADESTDDENDSGGWGYRDDDR
ncbi:DUF7544 domain-containing protein [Halovivax gelatinilyticus]|uniref:DUF7544 domain-containing protein n=1 Tax=Halovivax gelatinilyticus TaxID=2961597 RepID=UPI0020CA3334|nr:hypothetical protein [Halovivax gelatinilyticus]